MDDTQNADNDLANNETVANTQSDCHKDNADKIKEKADNITVDENWNKTYKDE